jgi:hypothetical protein
MTDIVQLERDLIAAVEGAGNNARWRPCVAALGKKGSIARALKNTRHDDPR